LLQRKVERRNVMANAREILEKVKKERGYIHPSRRILSEKDPDYLEIYHRLFTHVMKDREQLPLKVKEMIIAAVNAATNYEEGLRVHIRAALEAGAKEEEVFEAIEVASLPAGIHTITYSMPIFAEVCKEFRGKKRGKNARR
jgi:alkylhydroperoxidase/carboxymuconolactone decarboxylase family protein YurZ